MKANVQSTSRIDARKPLGARVTIAMENSPVSVILLNTTVRHLNERGLALMAKAARACDWAAGLSSWKEIRPFLARASESTLSRASRCPMTLLDFNFQRVAWWSRTINRHSSEDSRQRSLSAFHGDEAIPLAHDLLLEAWSAARSMSQVSSLVFGMAPEVTTLIAQLSPRDIDQLVVQEIQELRPRWETRPMFWKELFQAATQMDDEILENVYLHCLQLLGGELAFARGQPFISVTAAQGPVTEATAQAS
jgi:hypothetical protein